MSVKKDIKMKKGLVHLFLILGGVTMVLPFFWMLTTSIKSEKLIFKLPPIWIPKIFHFENYTVALDYVPLMRYFLNTLIIVFGRLFGEIFVSALVAFGFARFEFKGKRILFLVLLATMMIPYEVTMIPTFMFWSAIGLTDTYTPLILPSYFGAATFIFFLRMYFLTFPKELEESAYIDGASNMKIFWKIFVPMSKPALITIGLWSFIGTWNDLLGQLIYINSSEKFTVQLGLASFSNMYGETLWGPLMAASVLALLPIILVFLFAQKYFVQGIKMTGIKG